MNRYHLALALFAPASALGGVAGTSNGTSCDYATIQDAIDAGGGTIWVLAGDYSEQLSIDQSVMLIGNANANCNGPGSGSVRTRLIGSVGPQIMVSSADNTSIKSFDVIGGHDNNHGGNVLVIGSDDVVLEDVHLSEGSASLVGGGNLYAKGGSVALLQSTVSYGSAPQGGGIFTADADLILKESTIIRNNASEGAGVYMVGDEEAIELIVNDGSTITSNQASGNGGGVYAVGHVSIQADASRFDIESNTAAADGGGIYYDPDEVNASALEIANVDVVSNTAGDDGGGIYVTTCSTCTPEATLVDVVLDDNGATRGAGLAVDANVNSTLTVHQTRLVGNHASNEGGGAWVSSGHVDFLSTGGWIGQNEVETMFIENTAVVRGGGLFNYGDVDLNRVIFKDNDNTNANGSGPHEIGNAGNLTSENLAILGNGGMSVRTFGGGDSDFLHMTLDGGAGNGTILRYDGASTGSVVASIVLGGKVREWVTGDLYADCTLFTVTPTGTYADPNNNSCHGPSCDPLFTWSWQNSYTPDGYGNPSSYAVDQCAESNTSVDIEGDPRDTPDMGAFEW